jgi:hypothetical protein
MRNGDTMTTKPDLVHSLAGVTDIKDVRYLTFTKQLQAQAALAKHRETSFNLIISPNTQKISKNLWKAVIKSEGKVFEFNPSTEKWIERIVDGNNVLR